MFTVLTLFVRDTTEMVGYLLLFCFSMRHVFSKIVQNRMEKGEKRRKKVYL